MNYLNSDIESGKSLLTDKNTEGWNLFRSYHYSKSLASKKILSWKYLKTKPQLVIILGIVIVLFLFLVSLIGILLNFSELKERELSERKRLVLQNGFEVFHFALISDKDQYSRKSEWQWHSLIVLGALRRSPDGNYSILWPSESSVSEVVTSLSESGRSMELSELISFNSNLYSCDDRTGIIFELFLNDFPIPIYNSNFGEQKQFPNYDLKNLPQVRAIPRIIIPEGNGSSSDKGMKLEWATVRNNRLWLGSTGKEWTNKEGKVLNNNAQWVVSLDEFFRIKRFDWSHIYTLLREATQTLWPGYLLHEAVNWNPITQRWYFLPRRLSHEMYNEDLDQEKGTNLMISVDPNFKNLEKVIIGEVYPTRGYSSFKFVPGHNEILAIKSEEYRDQIATYISVFDIHGKILLQDLKIPDIKFEGLEFLDLLHLNFSQNWKEYDA